MPEIGVPELLRQLRSTDDQLRIAAAIELGIRCSTTEPIDPSAAEIGRLIDEIARDTPCIATAFEVGYHRKEREFIAQLDFTELRDRVQGDDKGNRISAARELANRFTHSRPQSASLTEVARIIAEVNERTGDVAAPFVYHFTYCESFTDAWHSQTDVLLTDWLSDVLCRAPDAEDEFAAYGLVDKVRYFLKGSPGIARRIFEAGKPWRAFLIASASEIPCDEERQLMDDLALVDDLRTATRATFRLAHTYRTVHPRAALAGWVVEEQLPPYQLFWCRFPQETLPHRVWGWRSDLQRFTIETAKAVIERIIQPADLGAPTNVCEWSFDTQGFRVCFNSPGTLRPDVFSKAPHPSEFLRFQLRPLRREPWVDVPRVQDVAARMLAAQQAVERS